MKNEMINKSEVMRKFASRVYLSNHADHVPPPTWNDAVQIVDSVPVATEVTGKWYHKDNVYGVVYCSHCDFELKINDTNYCPNCGVRMVKSEQMGF